MMSVRPIVKRLPLCLFLVCAGISVFDMVGAFRQTRKYGRVFLSRAQTVIRSAIAVAALALLLLIASLSDESDGLYYGVFAAAVVIFLLFMRSAPDTNLFFYLRGPSRADRERILQTAIRHKPDFIFADAGMTTLSPEVSAAMQLVFPGRARLEQALEAKPLPDLEQADTDTLLVLLKYATILPADEAVLSFQEAIIYILKRRGV